MPDTPNEPTPEQKRLREAYDAAFEGLKQAAAAFNALPTKTYPPAPREQQVWDDLMQAILTLEVAGSRVGASHAIGHLLEALGVPSSCHMILETMSHVKALHAIRNLEDEVAALKAQTQPSAPAVPTNDIHARVEETLPDIAGDEPTKS
jgi:hypothetical protein